MSDSSLTSPAFWMALASFVLGAFGVTDTAINMHVREVVGAAVALIVSVYIHGHHAHKIAAINATATVAAAKQATAAAGMQLQASQMAAQLAGVLGAVTGTVAGAAAGQDAATAAAQQTGGDHGPAV